MRRPAGSTLFPYTTLFRSWPQGGAGFRRHRLGFADARRGNLERGIVVQCVGDQGIQPRVAEAMPPRSEEHTSELQSRQYLVCRLLLEKKNKNRPYRDTQTL